MAINTTYAPQTWETFEAGKTAPNVIGATGTAAHGATTNIDTLISDDSFIRSIEIITKTANFGDTLTIEVIDKDAVYFSANTVVSTPVTNYNLIADQQSQISYDSAAPYKILGGLYVRVIYTSTGGTDVSVSVNYIFIKALV